jgi:hypothetical protein
MHVTSPGQEAGLPVSPRFSLTRLVIATCKLIFLAGIGVVWTVAGGAFWLMLLLRALGVFTVTLLASQFTHQNMPSIQDHLDYVAGFLFRGYRQLYGSIYDRKPEMPPLEVRPLYLLVEVLGKFLFWFMVVLLVAPERVQHAMPPLAQLADEASRAYTNLSPVMSVVAYFVAGIVGCIVTMLTATIFANRSSDRTTSKTTGAANAH